MLKQSNETPWSADDFRAWIERMGYNKTQAAASLGYKRRQIYNMLNGEVPVRLTTQLACLYRENQNAEHKRL